VISETSANGNGMPGGLDDHIYNRLLKERIIFLGSDVRDDNANAIAAQLLLLSAGTKGKRYATPHARVMMHQPSGGIGGTATDIKIQAEQMLYVKKQMAQLIAEHTGQTVDQIEKDSDRDRWFSAEEAKDYGFVDHVFSRSDQAVEGKGVGQADAKGEN
jgi:ATP-dependent Clp protease protease subunit